jgi:hypothetical protein
MSLQVLCEGGRELSFSVGSGDDRKKLETPPRRTMTARFSPANTPSRCITVDGITTKDSHSQREDGIRIGLSHCKNHTLYLQKLMIPPQRKSRHDERPPYALESPPAAPLPFSPSLYSFLQSSAYLTPNPCSKTCLTSSSVICEASGKQKKTKTQPTAQSPA